MRGDGDEADSNFMQLTKLRGEDDVRITSWLHAPDMQNEILKTMAMLILRQIIEMITTIICTPY